MENVIGKEANSIVLDEKPVKVVTDAERMTKEYNELKKKRSISVKKAEKVSKTTRKEVTIMSARTHAETLLAKVCKEMKLSATRIQAKSTSKSGIGAFQAKNNKGYLKVSVRDHDIVIFCPVSFLGAGRPGPIEKKGDMIRDYSQLAIVKKDDPNLDKLFKKALKDNKSWSEWATTARVQLKREVEVIKKVRKVKADKATPIVMTARIMADAIRS